MSRPKVLIVDHEPNARSALAALLRDEAFDVETARDGLDALAKQRTFCPQVVVANLEIRGMDGVELVRALQQVADRPSIIVMTSVGDTARTLGALRAGAMDYLTKPIRFDELQLVITKALRLHDLEHEIATLRNRESLASVPK